MRECPVNRGPLPRGRSFQDHVRSWIGRPIVGRRGRERFQTCYNGRRGIKQIKTWRVAFLFIGGVQPKKVQIDDQPRSCPGCGLPSARLKRLDHYVSLFFIPLFPVKKGERFLECSRCGGVFDEGGRSVGESPGAERSRNCLRCGRQIASDFQFCPQCGEPV